mmetsp:Transcript_3052/g.5332  ORF Transcript_3052/g.5332 Transcript_3052/m.5332 type:complete len:335 (-) Transcript_3052:197-1201(-)
MTARISINVAVPFVGNANSEVGKLSIEVQDSGPGMTQEAQGKIFGKFAQADASVSGRFGGSGLGLWICQKILVDNMNGKIGTDRVRTALGKGAVFQIEIPVKLSPSGISDPGYRSLLSEEIEFIPICQGPTLKSDKLPFKEKCPFASVSEDGSLVDLSPGRDGTAFPVKSDLLEPLVDGIINPLCLPRGSARLAEKSCSDESDLNPLWSSSVSSKASRLLIVDDCPVSCRMLSYIVRNMGYSQVNTCSDGPQAVSMLASSTKYDMLLTDYHIGAIKGTELVDLVRSQSLEPLWIIGMTGDESITVSNWKGVDVVIHKPFNTTSLKAALGTVCQP